MGNTVRAISVFHYHLRPGGVTSVIALACEAWAAYLPQIELIRLVSGSEEHGEEVAEKIRGRLGMSAPQIETAVLPEIGYVSGMPSPPSVATIKSRLRNFAGSLWWIHNYHLGKNPQFTQALLEILQEEPDQDILFHIHDFPECARYENLQRLQEGINLNPYPRARNLRYALINNRDRRLLSQSGLPERDLFLLNNPVRSSSAPSLYSREATRAKLEQAFGSRPGYRPPGRHLFYPVRTIRRKNILEAGYLTRLIAEESGEETNLIVTLPGVSATERRYSQTVAKAFEEELIPGLWGVGNHLDEAHIEFTELGRACDMVVASSVQEGFGYLFIEALQWELPLFARELEILDGIRGHFSDRYSRFYRSLTVPSEEGLAANLRDRYRKKLSRLAEHLPKESLARLDGEIGDIGREAGIDFSLLGVEEQLMILQRLADPAYRSQCCRLNRSELRACVSLFGEKPETKDIKAAEEEFSFRRFAETSRDIIQSYSEAPSPPHDLKSGSQSALLDAFARLEYLLLLYDYSGDEA